MKRRARILLVVILAPCLLAGLLLGFFAFNGLLLASRTTPYKRITVHEPKTFDHGRRTIKVLAYNIAKGFIHEGGAHFAGPEEVNRRMTQVAALISTEQPDFVFLSEAVVACGVSHINQVEFIAEQSEMHTWVFGENFNIGWPGFRMVSGNAILSRYPVAMVGNPDLAGRRPFYITKNNRRILWCRTRLAGEEILLGSIHTDSFDLANNYRQTEQILAFTGGRPALLAGAFNAQPDSDSIALIRQSACNSGSIDDIRTFPSHEPTRRLDYIFAPSHWELIEFRVLEDTTSDHLPVVAVYRLP